MTRIITAMLGLGLTTACASEVRGPEPPSAPAQRDTTSDNWGEPLSGIQISVGFRTNHFRAGDQIEAKVSLKNTATTAVNLVGAPRASITLRVVDGNTNALPVMRRLMLASEPESLRLEPGQRADFVLDLSKMYSLRAVGTYRISAERSFRVGPDQPLAQASSGVATLKIIPRDNPTARGP